MVAKGFGGNYFSLQAITATVAAVKLHKMYTIVRAKKFLYALQNYEESEDPPDTELFTSKPCYCNLFFACLAHKVLRLSRIKKPPICRCRKTKTGIAPPNSSIFPVMP